MRAIQTGDRIQEPGLHEPQREDGDRSRSDSMRLSLAVRRLPETAASQAAKLVESPGTGLGGGPRVHAEVNFREHQE